jgi:hypothetical protein
MNTVHVRIEGATVLTFRSDANSYLTNCLIAQEMLAAQGVVVGLDGFTLVVL